VLVVLADRDEPTSSPSATSERAHAVVDQLNTYDVLRSDVVVFDEAALDLIGTGRRASTDDTKTRRWRHEGPPRHHPRP
jgi:large subunit ribosomal protein L4